MTIPLLHTERQTVVASRLFISSRGIRQDLPLCPFLVLFSSLTAHSSLYVYPHRQFSSPPRSLRPIHPHNILKDLIPRPRTTRSIAHDSSFSKTGTRWSDLSHLCRSPLAPVVLYLLLGWPALLSFRALS